MTVDPDDPTTRERLRALLCDLGGTLRDTVLSTRDRARDDDDVDALAAVAAETAADTIYRIDRVGEDALLAWFDTTWPGEEPVEVVAEGLEERVVVPAGTAPDDATWTCIVDPIDGTRMLMHDKRSAWVLAAVAPRPRARPRLRDVVAAAMTELPPTKQRRADQLSAARGCGRDGIVGERLDLDTGSRTVVRPRPSSATDLRHGFASLAKFFPDAKALLARVEERLWDRLYGADGNAWIPVFDDQYLATGGQLHELLVGHDRLAGDLRPLAFAELGLEQALACHPYDACCALVLEEAGCVLTGPDGAPLDAPLDTTTPVAWVGYANAELAARVAPVLAEVIAEELPSSRSRS